MAEAMDMPPCTCCWFHSKNWKRHRNPSTNEHKTVTLKIDPSDESKDSPTIAKKSNYSQME